MMIRGNMKNWLLALILFFVAIFTGEICVSAAAKPVKLRVVMPAEPTTSGSLGDLVGAVLGEPLAYNVMEPLVDVGKKGEPVPKLATKWEHSADLTKWRFYLRKGVKFHNGADFTAHDVVEFAKWNIELKKESLIYVFVPLKEAVAVDDYTVDLIFEKPFPLFLINARIFLIPPAAISRGTREAYTRSPIGTGPYRLSEWKRGLYMKFAKFKGYWGPKPQVDDVEITFRPEEQVRLAALMAGEADWAYGLGPESARRAPKIARIQSPETVWIRFDEYIQKEWTGKDPIFSDKRLRLAVEYAIDRNAILALYGGFATPSLGQFASPGDFGFNPNLKSRPYDLEKAKALVKEAGAVGKTATFVCATDRWSKSREVGEAIAHMVEQTGLKVKLMQMPASEVSKYKNTQGKDREFMADMVIFPTDALLEVETRFPRMFLEGGGQMAVNDPESMERLYKEALKELNLTRRAENLAKAWAYAYEEVHYVPVFKLEWTWGVAKNLEWRPDITGRPLFADMKFTD